MMPCRTTRSFQSWNRWWTRSRVDSSAPKIQIFSKTSRTCSSNTTGEKQTHSSFTLEPNSTYFKLIQKLFVWFSSHDECQTSVHFFFFYFMKLELSDLICLSSLVSLQFQSVCRLWRLHEMPRESQPALSGNIHLKVEPDLSFPCLVSRFGKREERTFQNTTNPQTRKIPECTWTPRLKNLFFSSERIQRSGRRWWSRTSPPQESSPATGPSQSTPPRCGASSRPTWRSRLRTSRERPSRKRPGPWRRCEAVSPTRAAFMFTNHVLSLSLSLLLTFEFHVTGSF